MKVTFANSAHITTKERLVLGHGRWRNISLKVRYGLCLHPQIGPILIDTGYGPSVTKGAERSLGLKLYSSLFFPDLIPEQAPDAILSRLGYRCDDVKLVIISHFHADHIATLNQFPKAQFLARRTVFDALARRTYLQNLLHGLFPELLPETFSDRLIDMEQSPLVPLPHGLGEGWDLLGDGSLHAIDLPGHADGHFGLYFSTLDTPLLYGVDCQWLMRAITENRAPAFPASLIANDPQALSHSMVKLANFQAKGGDILLCHDPIDSPCDWPNFAQDSDDMGGEA